MEKSLKAYLVTGLVVLATLIVYNSFVKSFTPTSIRSLIGLG